MTWYDWLGTFVCVLMATESLSLASGKVSEGLLAIAEQMKLARESAERKANRR